MCSKQPQFILNLKILKNQRFWLVFFLAVLLCFFCFSPWKMSVDPTTLIEQMEQLRGWAIVGFILLYILLSIVGIPGIPLTMAGGLFFGVVWGTFWSVIAATLGAIAAFFVARYLLRDWVENKLGRHRALIRFNRATAKMPLKFVLFVRLAPILPFNLSNFLFGLTPIDLKSYVIGTFLGIIPGTLTYTWLGITGNLALQGNNRLSLLIGLALAIVLGILPGITQKKLN